MGWIFPAFFVGPPLLLAGALYFGVLLLRAAGWVDPYRGDHRGGRPVGS